MIIPGIENPPTGGTTKRKTKSFSRPTTTNTKDEIPVYKKSFSIKDAMKEKSSEEKLDVKVEKQEQRGERPTEPFTQEDLEKSWNAYAETIKEEKPRMYTTLKKQQPVLNNNDEIHVVLKNSAQKHDFDAFLKHGMMETLMRTLQNYDIKVVSKIAETEDDGVDRLYTPADKFQHLAKKNPELNKLKQDFNLDFD